MTDWRIATLPDGRHVEYIDAEFVSRFGDEYSIDVTVAIDGQAVQTVRVTVNDAGHHDEGER